MLGLYPLGSPLAGSPSNTSRSANANLAATIGALTVSARATAPVSAKMGSTAGATLVAVGTTPANAGLSGAIGVSIAGVSQAPSQGNTSNSITLALAANGTVGVSASLATTPLATLSGQAQAPVNTGNASGGPAFIGVPGGAPLGGVSLGGMSLPTGLGLGLLLGGVASAAVANATLTATITTTALSGAATASATSSLAVTSANISINGSAVAASALATVSSTAALVAAGVATTLVSAAATNLPAALIGGSGAVTVNASGLITAFDSLYATAVVFAAGQSGGLNCGLTLAAIGAASVTARFAVSETLAVSGQAQTVATGAYSSATSAILPNGIANVPATSSTPQLVWYATAGGAPLGACPLGGFLPGFAPLRTALLVSGQAQASAVGSMKSSIGGPAAFAGSSAASTASLTTMLAIAFAGLAKAPTSGSGTFKLGVGATIGGYFLPPPANAYAAAQQALTILAGSAVAPVVASAALGGLRIPAAAVSSRKPTYQPAALLLM